MQQPARHRQRQRHGETKVALPAVAGRGLVDRLPGSDTPPAGWVAQRDGSVLYQPSSLGTPRSSNTSSATQACSTVVNDETPLLADVRCVNGGIEDARLYLLRNRVRFHPPHRPGRTRRSTGGRDRESGCADRGASRSHRANSPGARAPHVYPLSVLMPSPNVIADHSRLTPCASTIRELTDQPAGMPGCLSRPAYNGGRATQRNMVCCVAISCHDGNPL